MIYGKHLSARFPRAIRQIAFVLLLGIFSSCGGSKNPTLRLNFQPGPDCNNGNPVVVWIYQLRSDAAFQSLSAELFAKNPQQALDTDKVAEPQEYTLRPGQILSLGKLKFTGETRFIAVLADFYQPTGDQWRLSLPIEAIDRKQVVVRCAGSALAVITQ